MLFAWIIVGLSQFLLWTVNRRDPIMPVAAIYALVITDMLLAATLIFQAF